ncbi:hypothetical protein ACFOON_13695 [Novosphingobium piscinae]|uniref:Uncharacterized protein n=1 Tax=Novosphingobium piscinae TaxID=1507448 RepID=A0A7X1FXP4_9SPHN|nr:hypothetical protein [Novosphingobium piscinae]MBC2668933.1 hypothetical protein [Novosphingobium piscinae]
MQFADSVWAVANMLGPASAVRDLVLKVLPAHSRVIVTEFDADADWATNSATDPAIAWLSGLPLALQEEHGEKVDRPRRVRELAGITAAGPWHDD